MSIYVQICKHGNVGGSLCKKDRGEAEVEFMHVKNLNEINEI
jgi:hypothetical protein